MLRRLVRLCCLALIALDPASASPVPFEFVAGDTIKTSGFLVAVPNGFEPSLDVEESIRARTVLEELGSFQGLRLVRIGFSTGSKVLGRVRFQRNSDPPRSAQLTPAGYRLLEYVTVNGKMLESSIEPVRGSERMWIVTPSRYYELLRPLAEWKTQGGTEVEIIDYESAGGTKESLLVYLKERYRDFASRADYLVLVGDKDSLPGFGESTSKGFAFSDYRYTLLDGDDPFPDIFVGRLLAGDEAEVATQVRRWTEYERTPQHRAFSTAAIAISGDEGGRTTDEEYARQLAQELRSGSTSAVDILYQSDGTATPARLTKALEEGRSMVTYFGHGNGHAWASFARSGGGRSFALFPEFNIGDLRRLDNRGRLPWIVDVACENASWGTIDNCFGKAWVTHRQNDEPAGAVAYFGASSKVTWHPPAVMAIGIARAFAGKQLPALGPTLFAGQMHALRELGVRSGTLDVFRWFNLFGDPSLRIH